jgi:hypothetical protein
VSLVIALQACIEIPAIFCRVEPKMNWSLGLYPHSSPNCPIGTSIPFSAFTTELKKTVLALLSPNATKNNIHTIRNIKRAKFARGKSIGFRRDGRSNINSQSDVQLRNSFWAITSSWTPTRNRPETNHHHPRRQDDHSDSPYRNAHTRPPKITDEKKCDTSLKFHSRI